MNKAEFIPEFTEPGLKGVRQSKKIIREKTIYYKQIIL